LPEKKKLKRPEYPIPLSTTSYATVLGQSDEEDDKPKSKGFTLGRAVFLSALQQVAQDTI
jgi:hypothetical protein